MRDPGYPVPMLARAARLPEPVSEFRFCKRMWRFDWAWPEHMVALEVDGGVWTRGRHVRGPGYVKDLEKLNTATALGWRVFRVTPQQVNESRTWDWIEQAIRGGKDDV